MRSIQSFRSRTRAFSISHLKARKRRLKHHSSAAAATTAAMHKRLRDLQRIVIPGRLRHETDMNHLFQRTADHIFALQLKLNILKDLTSLYGL